MARGKKASKSQRRDDQERKRDERARRNALRKEKDNLEEDGEFVSFSNQLQVQGLKIKEIIGDGNCLFRALGDQLDGDHTTHVRHRKETVEFIRSHRQDFEPFMEDNVSFDKHLQELAKPGTFGGNDSIVAFARNHGVNVVIHQLNEPRWVISGEEYSKAGRVIELHVSYHNGDHYSSVRSLFETDVSTPAWPHLKDRNLGSMDKKAATAGKKSKEAKGKQAKRLDVAASRSHEDSLAKQAVMEATGCKDLVLIAQTLEENMYDVDSSISYVLQMMCVAEDQDFMVNGLGFAGDQTETSGTSGKDLSTHMDMLPCDREFLNERTPGSNNEMKDFESSVLGESITASLGPRGENRKNLGASQSADTLPSSNSCTKENSQTGARPKVRTKSNTAQRNAPHLSNRKRKELAKQVKKKNREERKKQGPDEANVDDNEQTASSSIMADLGALAI